MQHNMLLREYFENGGTLETLHKSGASIIDVYQQPPFTEREVGRISSLKFIKLNENGRELYKVTYASGAVRESLNIDWITVTAKVKLDFSDIE